MARVERTTTYRNLIDLIISYEEKKVGNEELFQKILMEYFFKKECEEKKVFTFVKSFETPEFIKNAESIADIDINEFTMFVEGSDFPESLAGTIMLSKPYLKTFQQNHQPEFSKLPAEVQLQMRDDIRERNTKILKAFTKMHNDREADRSRTILRLVALILKNIQIRTGLPFSDMKTSAEEAIRDIFRDSDEIFTATKPQIAEMTDDKHIKALVKAFFVIRRNQDMAEISEHYRTEFERYRKRAERAFM